MDSLANAISDVDAVLPTSESSENAKSQIIDFLKNYPDALNRTCLDGHLTGSAAIVDYTGHRILIMPVSYTHLTLPTILLV